jgi:hypothetical protein
MTRRSRTAAPAGEYEIGYGRPPVASRFQPGRSGNPRGRPKGLKSISQLLQEALHRRVVVNENGRQRRIRFQDAIIQGLVNDAARRNHNALRLLFSVLDRYGPSSETAIDAIGLGADDSAIIASYLAALQEGQRNTPPGIVKPPEHLDRGSKGGDEPDPKDRP